MEFRRRKHSLQEAIEIFHNNPCRFLGQNPKFDIKPIRVEPIEEPIEEPNEEQPQSETDEEEVVVVKKRPKPQKKKKII